MPARNKKERKQQKQQIRRRREAARQQRRRARATDNSSGEEVRIDGPEPSDDRDVLQDESGPSDASLDKPSESEAAQSQLSKREEDALTLWWDKYDETDGPTRLRMTREKIATVTQEHEWYGHIFPEAVYELESKLTPEQYVDFLEELLESHQDVFSMGADWHTRSMVDRYLAQNRVDDVDRVVMALAANMEQIGDPFFSLTSTVRLAGRVEAARALVDTGANKLENAGLMPWAANDLLEWAMFPHYQGCLAAGATDEAIDAVHAAARKLGLRDSEEHLSNRREFVMHLAGKSGKGWEPADLITGKKKALRKIYLLCADYQRWLCEQRQFTPIVADELRCLVLHAIDGIDCPFNRLLAGLTRRDFEPYVAGKLGFMSLHRIHAPATIVAVKHYYDFLNELELVKSGDWKSSIDVCDGLWTYVRDLLDEWPGYRFLESYYTRGPGDASESRP